MQDGPSVASRFAKGSLLVLVTRATAATSSRLGGIEQLSRQPMPQSCSDSTGTVGCPPARPDLARVRASPHRFAPIRPAIRTFGRVLRAPALGRSGADVLR